MVTVNGSVVNNKAHYQEVGEFALLTFYSNHMNISKHELGETSDAKILK